jgi:glycosyltransferase involved in cell wall biosynthesis
MNTSKIHILYEFIEGPWGGGNQFLKALRSYFRKADVYAEQPEAAEVVLFNSHHYLGGVLKLKRMYPNKILIHRVDGPVSYVRGKDRAVDRTIFRFNSFLADGTIFQSSWSRDKNYELGIKKSPYKTVIMNAPDPDIFNREGKRQFSDKKVKLVATSWSENIRRGFEIYQYLDDHLDFSRYEMTFIGNSPIEFKNINWIRPVPSKELAGILREHDIYITASRNDPCSNALIEALHCGLPAVARNDGGHPEIIGQAGTLFASDKEVIKAIQKAAENYHYFQQKISLPTLDEIGQRYYDFAQSIYNDYLNGNYSPKRVNFFDIMRVRTNTIMWTTPNRLKSIIRWRK